jgi:DNA-binding SARP family transcriptional activator
MGTRYRFSILGPLEVRDGERVVPIRGGKLRTLLTVLLLKAGEPVAIDELVEVLWGGRPPASARRTLNVYVMRLRQAFGTADGHDLIRTTPGGYLLAIQPADLDLTVFEETLEQAGNAADPDEESRLLHRAISLWRGPTLPRRT